MTDEELQDRPSDAASPAVDAAVDVEPAAVEVATASAEDEVAAVDEASATDAGVAAELEGEPEPPTGPEAEVEPIAEPEGAPEPPMEPEAQVEPVVEAEPEPPVAPPAPVSAGRYVADALRSAGVKFAFTVPGESFLGLLDALEDAGIKVVATRHEGSAAFMAEAYGQLTGRPAACLGTRAVGAANLSIGIHTARQDSTPLFAVVGQVERHVRGREAFQEVDQVESFGRLAKWAVEVDGPAGLPEAMGEAVRRALSGRPGPILISLPEDMLDEEMAPGGAPIARRMTAPPPDAESLGAVLRLLAGGRRPAILAGAGVLRARRPPTSSASRRSSRSRSSRHGAGPTSSRTTTASTSG